MLAQFRNIKLKFFRPLITLNETLFVTPQRKNPVKTLDCKEKIGSKGRKNYLFNWKSDGDAFWVSHRILHIDYFEERKKFRSILCNVAWETKVKYCEKGTTFATKENFTSPRLILFAASYTRDVAMSYGLNWLIYRTLYEMTLFSSLR